MTESATKVLYAEDDRELAELVREYVHFRNDDIEVDTEWNGDDALAYLEAIDDVECVVSDYRMPGLDGLELLEAVRERWPDLPFILFTEQGNERVASRAITLDVTGYVRKQAGSNQLATLLDYIRDAVDRQQTERNIGQGLERDKAEFRLLVKTAKDYAVFSLNEDGYIETWNAGNEALRGYTSEEVIGNHISIFYPDEEVEAGVPERHLREAAEEGSVRGEGWQIDKEGSQFFANVTLMALTNGDRDDIRGYTSAIADRTAELERRSLRDQNTQLNHLLAAISHDLRGPLSVVRGNIELARETGDDSRLDAAEQALGRANDLLDSLGTLADEGRPIMDLEPVDLREVAERAWDNVVMGGEDLTIEGSTTLLADRQRLLQLFENLFRNAVEHVEPDVTVRVGPLENEGFYVEDDGQGIPEAERPEVFELGYSSDANGSGLGLAICQQIAAAHGWAIEITEGSDGGARFEISNVEKA